MNRSKMIKCLLGIIALMLVLSVTSPPPSMAYGCDSAVFWANATGSGSSCAAAEANCQTNAENEASYACSSINKPLCYLGTFEITQACTCSGSWHVSCRIEGACVAGPDHGD